MALAMCRAWCLKISLNLTFTEFSQSNQNSASRRDLIFNLGEFKHDWVSGASHIVRFMCM